MNAATADPQIDIANGKEPREFLGQSVGFENELIGQSNFPRPLSRARRAIARGQFLLTGRFSQTARKSDAFLKSVVLKIPSRTGRLHPEYAVNGAD
jgi:hypothetical protein